MKKLSVILFFALFIVTNSFKTAEEIKWLDFNTGYKLAVKKKKMMMVDVYTDWCGWCKVMDRETYAKSEIAALVNQHFVPIKFNPETPNVVYTFEGKDYNGKGLKDIISNNQIRGYPATMFINTKNKKSSLVSGYLNPQEFKVTVEHTLLDIK
jgi:uncharacterized protein YyaL (SSP411 family)